MINNNEDENMENENQDQEITAENNGGDGKNNDEEMAAMNDAEMQAALDPESANEEDTDENSDDNDEGARDDAVVVLEARVAELNDKLLRALSEAENTRRIAAREKTDTSKYAIAGFARDLIGVADNMAMALSSITTEARQADPNLENLYVGIEMTMNELLGAFERNGIKPIDAMDKQFDHNLMEALQQIPNPDVAEGTVVQVIRGGYSIHDRLLRPAQVLVASGGPKVDKVDKNENQKGDKPEEKGAEKAADGLKSAKNQAGYENSGDGPGANVDQET